MNKSIKIFLSFIIIFLSLLVGKSAFAADVPLDGTGGIILPDDINKWEIKSYIDPDDPSKCVIKYTKNGFYGMWESNKVNNGWLFNDSTVAVNETEDGKEFSLTKEYNQFNPSLSLDFSLRNTKIYSCGAPFVITDDMMIELRHFTTQTNAHQDRLNSF